MERKIITIKDFHSVARNNEYFLWHFLKKGQTKGRERGSLALYSFFEERENERHSLKELLDLINIPYFESYTEDSVDFLQDLGLPADKIWNNKESKLPTLSYERFNPMIIGFKKFTKINSTIEGCYCVDGVLDIISELNPEYLTSVDTED